MAQLGRAATLADIGIAARYPNDKNIANDPNVIFADDFESYTAPRQLTQKWTGAYQMPNLRIATESGNYYTGNKALEMTLQVSTTEVSNSLKKVIAPEQDTLYLRAYTKFDPNYLVDASNHNGLRLSAHYPGAGQMPPTDGTGFFLFLVQNNTIGNLQPGETTPGYIHLYAYWPKQRSNYGDHWYPTGLIKPGGDGEWLTNPGQYPDFKELPNWQPQRGVWYCYELMVKANTPGKNDGEVKVWIDGAVTADFPDLNLRSIPTLKLDEAHIGLHATSSQRVNKKWYDNVVIATKYIGPMATPYAYSDSYSTPTPTPRQPNPTQPTQRHPRQRQPRVQP